jgi:hypothetical protein
MSNCGEEHWSSSLECKTLFSSLCGLEQCTDFKSLDSVCLFFLKFQNGNRFVVRISFIQMLLPILRYREKNGFIKSRFGLFCHVYSGTQNLRIWLPVGKYTWTHTCLYPTITFRIRYLRSKSHHLNAFWWERLHALWK